MAAQSSPDRRLQPIDIIFSCNVCQDSIKELGKASKNNQALKNGRGPTANLWMTECAHVVCVKHLDGGAPPFHPADSAPRAVCPVCVSRSNNHALKSIYAISGYSKGEHDPEIPNHFFQCPPLSLDSADFGMDALRFQFLNLITYGIAVGNKYHSLQTAHARVKDQVNTLTAEKNESQTQLNALIERNNVLERSEKKRQEKDPEIRHYLRQFSDMKRELDRRYEDLIALGYNPPRNDYSFRPPQEDTKPNSGVKSSRTDTSEPRHHYGTVEKSTFALQDIPSVSSTTLRSTSSRTIGDEDGNATTNKRQKISEYRYNPQPPQQPSGHPPCRGEANTMPPPKQPASRISPMKNSPVKQPGASYDRSGRVIYANDEAEPNDFIRQQPLQENFKPHGYSVQDAGMNPGANNMSYMGGAIQVENVNPVQPSGRKRVRPMDEETDFDGRFDPNERHHRTPRYTQRLEESNRNIEPQNPNGNYRQPDHNNLPSRGSAYDGRFGPIRTSQQTRPDGYHPYSQASHSRNTPYRSPVKHQLGRPYTPSPQHIETIRQTENASVTSPFFRSRPPDERPLRNNGMDRSSSPLKQVSRAEYRMDPPQRPYQRESVGQSQTMNGLSFVQSPYIQSGYLSSHDYDVPRATEPLMVPQTPRNSQGLFVRPDTYQGSNHSNYNSHSSQRHGRPQPLPSATPSLASSLDMSRERRGLAQDLANVSGMKGVGSNDTRMTGGLFGPGRGVFSSAGRRSVRR